ncbi:MAG TPA: hypothetical protein VGL65_07550, partial [Gemmatimonadales bacterium]
MWLRYEHRSEPLLPPPKFFRRVGQHFLIASGLVLASLLLGMAGYRIFAGFSWVDAFLNAAMLLGGMGPVGDIPTTSGKVF